MREIYNDKAYAVLQFPAQSDGLIAVLLMHHTYRGAHLGKV